MTIKPRCQHPGGCDRLRHARGWCYAHYFRWRTTGDVGPAAFRPRIPGRTCSVDGCNAPHETRGWCNKHYKRWRTHGDPGKLGDRGPGVMGEAHALWRGDDISYAGIHDRLRAHRGSPSRLQCAHCSGPAAHWAYDHSDPDEKTADWYGYVVPYSTDLTRYMPLCSSCHTKFDRGGLRGCRP